MATVFNLRLSKTALRTVVKQLMYWLCLPFSRLLLLFIQNAQYVKQKLVCARARSTSYLKLDPMLLNYRPIASWESFLAAGEKFGLELLKNRRKSARIVLVIDVFSNNIYQHLIDQFDSVFGNTRFHNTRSVTHSDSRALTTNNVFITNLQ